MTAKKKIETGRFKERTTKWAKENTTPIKVPADKLNQAIPETALNRMGYHQGPKPIQIDPTVQAVADNRLDVMDCPLSHVNDWDCNRTRDDEELSHPIFDKGNEPQCKNGGFVNCPAYHRYFNWRMKHQAGKRGKGESTE